MFIYCVYYVVVKYRISKCKIWPLLPFFHDDIIENQTVHYAIIQRTRYKNEKAEKRRLLDTLFVLHFPYHQPFVLCDLISEDVFCK